MVRNLYILARICETRWGNSGFWLANNSRGGLTYIFSLPGSHQEHQEWNKEQRKTSSWHRAFFPASVHSFLFFFPIKNSQALGGCFRNELRRYLSVASRVTSTTGRYYNLLLEEEGRRKQLATPLQKKTGIYVSHFLGIFLMKKSF